MPALCVDIDNVLGKTDEVIRRVIRDYTAGRVDLQYTDITQFDYCKCVDRSGSCITTADWEQIHALFSEPEYLEAIQPVDNVQKCLQMLSLRFDFHFATSRLTKARRATIDWLEKNAFPYHDLHFLKHGEKHTVLRGFYAAVEDNYDQAASFARTGIPCYLIEHPWNKGKPAHKDVYPVSDWMKLTEILLAAVPDSKDNAGRRRRTGR
jgi:uncharacterized HAD superfamily protein